MILARNGEICVCIPLYRSVENCEPVKSYTISLQMLNILAYVIETRVGNVVWNKDFVEKNFEFLGDL